MMQACDASLRPVHSSPVLGAAALRPLLPHTSCAVWAPRLTTAHRPLPCLQAPANPLEPVVGGALGDGDVLMTLNSDCFGLVRGCCL